MAVNEKKRGGAGSGGEVDVARKQVLSGADGAEPPLAPPQITENDTAQTKLCAYCGLRKPLTEFKRRTGKRRGAASRRGACKACRQAPRREQPGAVEDAAPVSPLEAVEAVEHVAAGEPAATAPGKKKRRRRRRKKAKAAAAQMVHKDAESAAAAKKPLVIQQVSLAELKAIGLIPNYKGFIRMRGKTDNGRSWHQEIDPGLALTLVKERAAVVVSRHMIRRLYSNKEFRRLILERDQYTCRFCGQYGDTIDHMLPRSKGGHTTPDNCVCACYVCNQSKADQDMDKFIQ